MKHAGNVHQLIFAAALWAVLAVPLHAQDGFSTKGTEFWVGFMQNFVFSSFADEELSVLVTASQNTTGTVSIPAQGWSESFTVTANQTTTIVIPNGIAEHMTSHIIEPRGIHITTADTVAVFASNAEVASADATRILPIQSLGSDYRILSFNSAAINLQSRSEFVIVATEDDTEIEITPTATPTAIPPLAANTPYTITLNRGESYQLKAQDATLDLTGTRIRAVETSGTCRPFAVFSGNNCARVPNACLACDHIFEQCLPVTAWGTEYIAVPFVSTAQYSLRVLAHADNTTVSISGEAPVVLNAGQYTTLNALTDAVCVSATSPVSVAQFMEGFMCAGAGDPAMVLLNANDQRIQEVTFSTLTSSLITDHQLTLVVSADDAEVTLNGAPVSLSEFTPVAGCSAFLFAHIALPEGSHTLQAPGGANAYLYGVGEAEGYVYSAGSFFPPPPADEVLCGDTEITLDIEANLINPQWFMNSDPSTMIATGHSLTLQPPIASGQYVGIGESPFSGCEVTQVFEIENGTPPEVVITAESTNLCSGQSTQLTAEINGNDDYSIAWSPTANVDDPSGTTVLVTPSQTSTYTVTIATPNGCGQATASQTVTVLQSGVTGFTATADALVICEGDTVDLTATLESVVFEDNFDPGISWGLWENIANGAGSANCGAVSGNALYFNGNGARAATSIAVNTEAGGTVSFYLKLGSDAAPCDQVDPGEGIVLEYTTSAAGGPYSLMASFEPGDFDEFTLVTLPIPVGAQNPTTWFRWRQVAHSGNNQDNWAIDNVAISALNAINPQVAWSPSSLVAEPESLSTSATPLTEQWFTVTLATNQGNCIYTDSVHVTVTPAAAFTLTADTTLCTPGLFTLTATTAIQDDYTFNWQGAIVGPTDQPTAQADANQSGTFTVDVGQNGCFNTQTVELTVTSVTDVSLSADADSLCEGETLSLTASYNANGPHSFSWSGHSQLEGSGTQATLTPVESLTAVFTVVDESSGCVLSDSLSVHVSPAFSLSAGEDLELCNVEGHQLHAMTNATQPLSFVWSNPGVLNDATLQNPTVTQNGNFTFEVTATDAFGCAESASVNLDFVLLDFGLGDDLSACLGEVVTLASGLSDQWQHEWSTGATTTTIEITDSGVYTVSVASPDGCEMSDSISVAFIEAPTASFEHPELLCEGETFVLEAGVNADSYAWSTGESGPSIAVSESGNYTLQITVTPGCSSEASITLTFEPRPEIPLPPVTAICEDGSGTLDAGDQGAFYFWSTGDEASTLEVNTSGMYSVLVTAENGCSAEASTEVLFADYPSVDLGSDRLICEGDLLILDAGDEGNAYLWSTGDTTQTITITESGTYAVNVDNGVCSASDAVSITVASAPVQPQFEEDALCEGDVLFLNAENPGSLYTWSTGSNSATVMVTFPGTYWVRVTTPLGCEQTFYHTLIDACEGHTLFIPNAFTPGTDGVNDVLQVKGTNIASFQMDIYDRWGVKIAELNHLNDFWDGSFRNGEHYVQAGVYVYRASYTTLNPETGRESDLRQRDGSITVIR